MDTKSVLHIHTLPIISGSGINTLLTMKGTFRRGWRVGLACGSKGRLTAEAEKLGISVHLVPYLGREIHPIRDVRCVYTMARLIQRRRYDIVHTHNSKAGFVGRLSARLGRAPLVVHTVHGFAFHDQEPFHLRYLYRQLERLAAYWCDGMIFISQPLIDWAERERIGAGLPRRLIYSGIDLDAFRKAEGAANRRGWGIEKDRLVVGMVSKLWEGKGHRYLLEAWRQLLDRGRVQPLPLLVIAGEGQLEGQLKELVRQWELEDSVLFVGFHADVAGITAALDIAVLPSLFEGMGRVVLEAHGSGKPVIGSRVGGIPDLIHDGVNGLLVPAGDVAALHGALERLLVDDALRHRLSEGAQRSMKPEYTVDHMISAIHEFYSWLARRRRKLGSAGTCSG